MANKILKLQSRQPNKPLIELLEKLLDDARDGSLVTMIAVTETRKRSTSTRPAGSS